MGRPQSETCPRSPSPFCAHLLSALLTPSCCSHRYPPAPAPALTTLWTGTGTGTGTPLLLCPSSLSPDTSLAHSPFLLAHLHRPSAPQRNTSSIHLSTGRYALYTPYIHLRASIGILHPPPQPASGSQTSKRASEPEEARQPDSSDSQLYISPPTPVTRCSLPFFQQPAFTKLAALAQHASPQPAHRYSTTAHRLNVSV